MAVSFVYITASSVEEAEIIGRNLVSRKLAACVNIISGMKSIYHWEGKIETGDEVILIAKTKEALVDELTENVKALHSYKCPCVISLPVLGATQTFLNGCKMKQNRIPLCGLNPQRKARGVNFNKPRHNLLTRNIKLYILY